MHPSICAVEDEVIPTLDLIRALLKRTQCENQAKHEIEFICIRFDFALRTQARPVFLSKIIAAVSQHKDFCQYWPG